MSSNDGIALIVCVVYRSPQNSQFATDEDIYEILESEYLEYHLRFSDFTFIIVGDFNGRTGIKNDALLKVMNARMVGIQMLMKKMKR